MRLTLIIALFATLGVFGCQQSVETPSNNGSTSTAGSGSKDSVDNSSDESESDEADKSEDAEKDTDSGIQAIYTDLAEDKCEDVDSDEEEAWSVQSCKGVGGYTLNVSEGDLRQTIDIISPDEKKFELNLWSVVSSGFSLVGDKAEWRVVKENGKLKPVALIVRYNVSEKPDNPDKMTSYLTVSKITATGACVTDIVNPIPNANVKARQLADASASKPCLKSR